MGYIGQVQLVFHDHKRVITILEAPKIFLTKTVKNRQNQLFSVCMENFPKIVKINEKTGSESNQDENVKMARFCANSVDDQTFKNKEKNAIFRVFSTKLEQKTFSENSVRQNFRKKQTFLAILKVAETVGETFTFRAVSQV